MAQAMMAQAPSGQGALASATWVQVHPLGKAAASTAAALGERSWKSAFVAVYSGDYFSASEPKQPVKAAGPNQPLILPERARVAH